MDMTGRGGRPTRANPLPPHPGNTHRSFSDLIRVEKIDDRTFRSIAPPFAPGGPVGVGRSYGAHVYMQAAWAACQTVESGFLLHSVSGNFILGGQLAVPFVYKVHIIRNGRSYCTRIVNVTQSENKGICFTCICSFKTPELKQIVVQDQMDLFSKYSSALSGKKPEDFLNCPSMDLPWYWKRLEAGEKNEDFPGLECRKVDMTAYNRNRHGLDRRQLIFYRPVGEMSDDPNMHLCAHILASDRNSLYIVSNVYDIGDHFTAMSSLTHTVSLHGPPEALNFTTTEATGSPMDNTDGKGRWFCMEAYGTRLDSGRALYNARFWSNNNTHVMTAMQDGLIRLSRNPTSATKEEDEFMDAINEKWSKQDRRKVSEKL